MAEAIESGAELVYSQAADVAKWSRACCQLAKLIPQSVAVSYMTMVHIVAMSKLI